MRFKIFICLVGIVLLMFFASAIPQILVNLPSSSPYYTNNNSVELNFSIAESSLGNITYNWNGTNFSYYDNSLLLMYNFENLSALGENSTRAADVSKYSKNATLFNIISNSTSGVYGRYIQLNGTSWVNVSGGIPFGSKGTISFWIYWKGTYPGYMFDTTDDSHRYLFYVINSTAIGFYIDGTQIWDNPSNGLLNLLQPNTWTHITLVYNTSDANKKEIVYKNGAEFAFKNVDFTGSSPVNFFIGKKASNGEFFNGSFDEFRIWNRSLSAQEVYQQYASNLQKFNSTQWYLYVNQSKNATARLDNATYTYQLFATNSSGSLNFTDLRTVIVGNDTSPPKINFTYPTPDNATTTTNTSVQINVSISGNNLASFIYNFNKTNYSIYDNSLLLMMNFENRSSLGENSTYVADLSVKGNNGTVINGALWNSSGKYGGAMQFDGVNDYIRSNALNITTNNITICAWIKGKYTNEYTGIIFSRNSFQPWGINYRGTSGQLSYHWNNNSADTYNWVSNLTLTNNTWTFVALSMNASQAKLYMSNTSGLFSATNFISHIAQTLNSSILIGKDNDSETRYYNGTIDEVRIWNRSLSDSEIQEIYMSNLQKYNSTQWYFYVNQSKNSTAGLDIGNYTYQTFATDSTSLSSTEQRTITIGQEYPKIRFELPTPDNATTTTNTSVQINVSISENNLNSLTYNWNGTNFTMYNNSLLLMYNFDNVSSLGENSTYVVDLSGNGNNGTILGMAVWNSTGKYGGSYMFNTTNYITVPSKSYLKPPIYVSFWVNQKSNDSRFFIVKYGGSPGWDGWGILANASGNIGLWKNGNNEIYSYSPTGIIGPEWSHVYAEIKTAGQCLIYLNGNLVLNVTDPSNSYSEDVSLAIGQQNGSIDELRFWNRSLSQSEIYQQYASNLQKFNSTQWYFYVNQSKNPTAGLDAGTYTYQIFDTNSSGNLNSTEQRTIIIGSNSGSQGLQNQSSENSTAWWMFMKYLNHTSWDGNSYSTISGLNLATYSTGGEITMSSPAVANGYVYIGGFDKKVYQLNASNVSQLISKYAAGNGISSSPVVVNGYVYIGSADRAFYQLNASDVSRLIAKYTTGDQVVSSPAVANGYVYVGSLDGKFYQLNASDVSRLIAKYTTGDQVVSSPAVANGYVYVGSHDKKLYQLNASNVSQLIASYTTGGIITSSPAIVNGYVYVGSLDKKLYQLNASNVSQLIASYTTGGIIQSSPAVANGYVYIGGFDKKVYQLNASNVSRLISIYNASGEIAYSSPAIANGYVYIGSYDNKLYQLNASNVSQLIASYTTGGIIQSSPAVANGYVYFGSWDYKFYQLNASNISLGNPDSTPPSVNFTNPANNTYVNGNVTIQAVASDAGGIKNVTFFYRNSTTNYSSFCSASMSPYTCYLDTNLLSDSAEGYDINATAYDNSSNSASVILHLAVDRNIPITSMIDVIYPSGQTSVRNMQNITLEINTTDGSGSGIDTVKVNTSSLGILGNTTLDFSAGSKSSGQWSYWNKSITINASTGNYQLPIYVSDLASPLVNVRTSDRFYVIVDNDTPTYSEQQSYGPVYNHEDLRFSIKVADNYEVASYIFSTNLTGIWENDSSVAVASTIDPLYVTKTATTGNYSYRFYIFDDAGNMNASAVSAFEVYGDRPQLTILPQTPEDGFSTLNTTVNFSYMYTSAAASNCSLYINSEINQTMNSPARDTILSFSPVEFPSGVYLWDIKCADNETNEVYSSNSRTLVIEEAVYPVFFDYYDNSRSLTNNGIGLFNVTISNTNGTVWLSINNANYTASNNSDIYNVSVSLASAGTYNYIWYAYGNGITSLLNNSETRTYLVNASSSGNQTAITQSSGGGDGNYMLEQDVNISELKIKTFISPNKTIITGIKQDKGTGIKEIELKSKNWLSGEIYIVAYNETPDFCSIQYKNEHKVYKVLEFNNTIKDETIDFGRIKIGVEKDWIYSNNISEIKFVKCSPAYEEVASSYDSETKDEGIYNVYITGFSTYAILGTLEGNNVSAGENNKNNSGKGSFWRILLWILLGIVIFGIILVLIKNRVYFKEKIHNKFFDFEIKLRIGKGKK
jgi:outer membrane protein assembly factor BamB